MIHSYRYRLSKQILLQSVYMPSHQGEKVCKSKSAYKSDDLRWQHNPGNCSSSTSVPVIIAFHTLFTDTVIINNIFENVPYLPHIHPPKKSRKNGSSIIPILLNSNLLLSLLIVINSEESLHVLSCEIKKSACKHDVLHTT